jgi:hypothetical protein
MFLTNQLNISRGRKMISWQAWCNTRAENHRRREAAAGVSSRSTCLTTDRQRQSRAFLMPVMTFDRPKALARIIISVSPPMGMS